MIFVIKKNIAFISVARSDFGRLFPSMERIKKSPEFNLQLIVSGNHSSGKFGSSIDEVQSSGLEIDCKIDLSSEDIAEVSVELTSGLNQWFETSDTDLFVILGDRYEMLAAAQAAFLNKIPIIHIGGCYQTIGAIDDRVRHAITQLSTYHFTASEKCRQRVIELIGKDKNIFLSGAPDLEILKNIDLMSKEDFYKSCNLQLGEPFVLVTVHPETLKSRQENFDYLEQFRQFLLEVEEQVLISAPCADPGADIVFKMIDQLKLSRGGVIYIESLGMKRYAAAMRYAEMMIGNSSSGVIESASMGIPVLNVGERQGGRESNNNVLDSSFRKEEILETYKTLKSSEFKKRSSETINIYGDGDFSECFLHFLKTLQ